MKALRKLLSILLLVVVGLPYAVPLFAQDAGDAALPACCRRNGKHHCMMDMEQRRAMLDAERGAGHSDQPQFAAVQEKCPYCPAMVTASHLAPAFGVPASQIFFAGLVSHPAAVAQVESKWRIARDRSRQKRGPPVSILL